MKKMFKRIAFVLIFTLVAPAFLSLVPSVNSLTAKEAMASTLSTQPIKVGINSSGEWIGFNDRDENAVFTYTAADPDIISVGDYGDVTGIKKGKSTVSVKQTLNGVTSDVGTVSVDVVNPELMKNTTVGLGSYTNIPLFYANREATYKFKVSDKSVIKIDEYGTIDGLKFGKSKITVTQTYKKKTTTIGTVTVSVVKASLRDKKMDIGVNSEGIYVPIDNRNAEASYKFSISDKKIAKVDNDGVVIGLKKGSTKVTVTEIYKKKKSTIGTVTVNVSGASLDKNSESVSIGVNSLSSVNSVLSFINYNYDAKYTCESADNNIVYAGDIKDEWDDSYYRIKGVSLGKTTLSVFEEYNGKKEKIGTVNVSVIEIPVTNMTLEMYDDNDNKTTSKTYTLGQKTERSLSEYVNREPNNATTPFTYSSSNDKIVKVDNNGYVTAVAEGSADITITCGKFSVTFKAIVQAINVESFNLDEDYFSEEAGVLTRDYLIGEDDEICVKDYLIVEPYDTTTPITYSSSDEKVAKVDSNGNLTLVAKGKAVITIKCGKFTKKFTAIVDSDDYDSEEDY